MLDYILLGAIQGITEFLPISSSGHLIFVRAFLDVPQDYALDVVLHFGTLLAILFFYRKTLLKLVNSTFKDLIKYKLGYKKYSKDTKISFYILLASIPTLIIGFLFKDFFMQIRSDTVVAIMLFIGGIVMLVDVAFEQKRKTHTKLNFKNALVIGLAQPLALIPGTSRSGSTIVTGSLLGLKKVDAANFSFLLSIPAIFGAFIFSVLDVGNISYFLNPNLLMAFLTSFIVGVISIKLLLNILKKWGFMPFAVYRIALAFLILLFFV